MRLDLKTNKYASALYSIAQRFEAQKEVLSSLALVKKLLQENSQFKALLITKVLRGEKKSQIISDVLGDSCHEIVSNFLGLLADDGMLSQFHKIEKAFSLKYAQDLGLVKVTAQVSQLMSDSEQQSLRKSLNQALGKNVDLNVILEPELLGGIKLRIGNIVVDASIQNQIKSLRLELLKA